MKNSLDFTKFSINTTEAVVRFGPADKTDKYALLELCIKTMENWGMKIDSALKQSMKNLLDKQIENKLVICAYSGSQVIGFTSTLNMKITSCLSPTRMHITNTVVHPDHRKKGIANQLRKIIIRYAVNKGYSLLTTNHHRTNSVMQRLSEKFNFKVFEENELLPVDPDSISYRLYLTV
jgi:ribosomal protein S18 acetylase RimI-like enzyme